MPRLDHVALRVADLDASIAFYTETIGLPFMFRELDAEHHEAFAYLEAEGGNLELLQPLDADNRPVPFSAPAPEPPYCPHIALGVEDVDAMAARLGAAGAPLLAGPLEIPGKVRWAYVADPDNNVLEFVQWL